MWALFIALLSSIIFAQLSKNFGTFYLSEDESATLNLNDYFSANETDFWISNTNSTSKDILLSQNSNMHLLSYFKYEKIEDFQWDIFSSKNFPRIYIHNGCLIFWYKGKEIVLYLMKEETHAFEKLWTLEIGDKSCKGEITQLRAIPNTSNISILALLRCYRNGYWENEFYKFDITYEHKWKKIIKLNLWDVKYLNDPQISFQDHFAHFSIFGRFKSEKLIMFIYRFDSKSESQISLLQTMNSYSDFNQLKENSFNIAQVRFTQSYMEILDTHLGLIFYSMNWIVNKFEQRFFCNLTRYEPLYTFSTKLNTAQSYVYLIGAEQGAIVFLRRSYILDYQGWIDIHDAIGYYLPVKSLSIDKGSALLYVNGAHESFLLHISLDQDQDLKLISCINVRKLIGKDFNPYGRWASMKLDSSYFYIRSDHDGIRLFSLDLKSWQLTIWGNQSFYAEITGKTANKHKKHTKNSLNVISIPLESNEIFKVQNYKEINTHPMEIIFHNNSFTTYFNPNLYFSGPNLTFSISNIDFPNEFSVYIEDPEIENRINLIKLPKKFDTLKVNFEWAGAISDEGLWIIDMESDTYEILNDSLKVTNFIWWKMLIIAIQNKENEIYSALFYNKNGDTNNFSLVQKYKLDINCEILKLANSESSCLFVCANSESIYYFQYVNSEVVIVLQILKDQLNSFGVQHIIDIEIFWNYSSISMVLILYIIDKYNGLLAIECFTISYLCRAIPNLAPIKPSNIKLISAAEHIIYVVCNDGIIKVYDRYLYHLKSLSTHIKGNIITAYSASNILLVQIDNHIEILDGYTPAHNSLHYSFDVDENCWIIKTESYYLNLRTIPFIPVLCSDNSLHLYEYNCNNYLTDECVSPYWLHLSVKPDAIIKKDEYVGKMTLMVKNSAYSLSTDLYFKISICKNEIWVNSEKIPNQVNVIYNAGKNISLEGIFYGNDLNIAFQLETDIYNDSEILPITLHQFYQKSYSFAYNNTKFYDHIFIDEIKTFIIASNKGMLILSNDNDSANFESISLEMLFPYNIIACTSLSNLGLRDNFILIASICSYQMLLIEPWNENLKVLNLIQQALIIIEYDFQKKSVSKLAYTYLGQETYLLKSVRISEFRFDIFLTQSKRTFFSKNNWINWYKGIWNQNILTINFEKEINNELLGINEFLVKSIDVDIFESSQIVLYTIDAHFGLRVILIDENNQVSIIENISHIGSNTFSSVCKSPDKLFIFSDLYSLFRYSIDKNSGLVFDNVIHSNLGPQVTLDYIEPILCTSQYVFKTTIIKYEVFLEIWKDLYKNEIKIGNLDGFKINLSVQYIGDNTFSLIKDPYFSLEILNFIEPFLEISPISRENYTEIKNLLQNDEIDVEIYAYNEIKRTNISNIKLKLSEIKEMHSDNWMWLVIVSLICVVLIAFGLTIVYFIKKKMSNTNNYIEEGLILEEFKSSK